MMKLTLRRWPSRVIALAIATAVTLTSSTPAFAAQWDEEATWHAEVVSGGQISTPDTVSEARGAQNVLGQVWRDASNQIWVSINHLAPFRIGGAQTYVAPRIAGYGNNFIIIHTGTNNKIYETVPRYGISDENWLSNPGNWNAWNEIPNLQTRQSVDVKRLYGQFELYLVFLDLDSRIMGTYTTGNGWNYPVHIVGGYSDSAPTLAWNARKNQLITAIRGWDDDQVYTARQQYGTSGWDGWFAFSGVVTWDSPVVSANSNGDEFLAVRHTYSGKLYFKSFGIFAGPSDWTPESTGWSTNVAPYVVAGGVEFWIIFTGLDNKAYWKQAYAGALG
jgi:hypothetical protein